MSFDSSDYSSIRSVALARPNGTKHRAILAELPDVQMPWEEVLASFTPEDRKAAEFVKHHWVDFVATFYSMTDAIPAFRPGLKLLHSQMTDCVSLADPYGKVHRAVLKILSFQQVITVDQANPFHLLSQLAFAALTHIPQQRCTARRTASMLFSRWKNLTELEKLAPLTALTLLTLYSLGHYLADRTEEWIGVAQLAIEATLTTVDAMEQHASLREFREIIETFEVALADRRNIFPLLLCPLNTSEESPSTLHPRAIEWLKQLKVSQEMLYTHFFTLLKAEAFPAHDKKSKAKHAGELKKAMETFETLGSKYLEGTMKWHTQVMRVLKRFQDPAILAHGLWGTQIQALLSPFEYDVYNQTLKMHHKDHLAFEEHFKKILIPCFKKVHPRKIASFETITVLYNICIRDPFTAHEHTVSSLYIQMGNYFRNMDFCMTRMQALLPEKHQRVSLNFTTKLDVLIVYLFQQCQPHLSVDNRLEGVFFDIFIALAIMRKEQPSLHEWLHTRKARSLREDTLHHLNDAWERLAHYEPPTDIVKTLQELCRIVINFVHAGEWLPLLLTPLGHDVTLDKPSNRAYMIELVHVLEHILFTIAVKNKGEQIQALPVMLTAEGRVYQEELKVWGAAFTTRLKQWISRVSSLPPCTDVTLENHVTAIAEGIRELQDHADASPNKSFDRYLTYHDHETLPTEQREQLLDFTRMQEWKDSVLDRALNFHKTIAHPLLEWHEQITFLQSTAPVKKRLRSRRSHPRHTAPSPTLLAAAAAAVAVPKTQPVSNVPPTTQKITIPRHLHSLYLIQAMLHTINNLLPDLPEGDWKPFLQHTLDTMNGQALRLLELHTTIDQSGLEGDSLQALFIALAALIEQTVKHACVIHDRQNNPILFETHNLTLLLSRLESFVSLTTEQRDTCTLFSQVLHTSGRYPRRVQDRLSQELHSLDSLEQRGEEILRLSETLLQVVQHVLKAVHPTLMVTEHPDPVFWLEQQAATLNPQGLTLLLQDDSTTQCIPCEEALEGISTQLQHLDHHYFILREYNLPMVHPYERESDLHLRYTIIHRCLKDLVTCVETLSLSLEHLREGISFYSAEQVLLHEGVLWELLLTLIITSHPIAQPSLPHRHLILFQATLNAPPLWCRHELVQLTGHLEELLRRFPNESPADPLPFLHAIRQRSTVLQPVVKQLFRYRSRTPHAEVDTLHHLHLLSALAQNGLLTHTGHSILSKHLHNKPLSAVVSQFLHTQILNPCADGLALAHLLLRWHAKNLNQTS